MPFDPKSEECGLLGHSPRYEMLISAMRAKLPTTKLCLRRFIFDGDGEEKSTMFQMRAAEE